MKGEPTPIVNFFEDEDKAQLEQLSYEFNTLSIIRDKPQEKFLKEEVLKVIRKAEKYKKEKMSKTITDTTEDPVSEEEEEVQQVEPEDVKQEYEEFDLIDFGDSSPAEDSMS